MSDTPHAAQPQSFWLPSGTGHLLCWLHAPSAPIRDAAVLICPPFGHEYMVSYQALRQLAQRLAQAGYTVLVPDYRSCGDASDCAALSAATWQEDLQSCATFLRQQCARSQLVLFGLRLGALLAASVAAALAADALLLCAPIVSGRAYVRELLILRQASPITPDPRHPERLPGEEEMSGYAFPATLRGDLAALDLLKLPLPACPVLIQSRDDISGNEARLAHAWHGTPALTLSSTPGYAAMLVEDAHQTTVPDLLWQEACDWLCTHLPAPARALPPLPAAHTLPQCVRMDTPAGPIQERLLRFAGLVGVLSSPLHPAPHALPALIFTNIGANHRVGTHRLYVHLARQLAAQGYDVLRLDKSGIGYSRPTPEGRLHDVHGASGIADIEAAMHELQTHAGHARFVLAGLCSGAYLSYLTALQANAAVGLILINQLTYHWKPGDTVEVRRRNTIKATPFYLRAATRGNTWRRLLRGQINLPVIVRQLAVRLACQAGARLRTALLAPLLPRYGHGRVARNFTHLLERGCAVQLIYDENDGAVDVMLAELGPDARWIGPHARLDVCQMGGVDHTFTPRWAQAELGERISVFLERQFAPDKR